MTQKTQQKQRKESSSPAAIPDDFAEICLKHALAHGADAADVVVFENTELATRRRMGKLEIMERCESRGLGLRVLVEGKGGYRQAIVSGNDVAQGALYELVERAVSMARVSPPDPFIALAGKELLARDTPDLDVLAAEEPTPAYLQGLAAEAEEAALAVKSITNSDGAEAGYERSAVTLLTSNGFSGVFAGTSFSLSVSVVAGKGTGMETDFDYHTARHAEDLLSAAALGKNAGERAVKRLHPKKMGTGNFPVVFEPRVARGLLGCFAGAICGDAVARGTSFLKESLGKPVFARGITIIDDPLVKRGLASEPFDAEGVRGKKRALIEDGVLQTWLLDMRSAKQLGLVTTGRAARGLASPPSPGATNLHLEAGALSPEELMADIAEGFYVTDTFGMGINGVTGDYSQGASGFWIARGKLTHAVSEMTIAGNLRDMFLRLTPASDLICRDAINAPTVRVEGMMVAGV